MKTIKTMKKLSLNKETVANFAVPMNGIQGGIKDTVDQCISIVRIFCQTAACQPETGACATYNYCSLDSCETKFITWCNCGN